MEVGSQEELLVQLIDRALSGQHTEWKFIRSFNDYLAIRTCRYALYKVYRDFARQAKSCYSRYVRAISDCTVNPADLYRYVTFTVCANFFKEEYLCAQDMYKEYGWYLLHGHIFAQLFMADTRPDEDCVDTRIRRGYGDC